MAIFYSRIHTLDTATKLQIRTKDKNINGNRSKNKNIYMGNKPGKRRETKALHVAYA